MVTSPSASPQYTTPLAVAPHIDAEITDVAGGGAEAICRVVEMLVKRSVDETSCTPLECPQQNASPSALSPHVPSLAEMDVSAGTALTRNGVELQGVCTVYVP